MGALWPGSRGQRLPAQARKRVAAATMTGATVFTGSQQVRSWRGHAGLLRCHQAGACSEIPSLEEKGENVFVLT